MKPNVQRKGNITQTPGRHGVTTSKVKKGPSRQKVPVQKVSDEFDLQGRHFSIGQSPDVLPFHASGVLCRQLSVSEQPTETRKEVTELKLKGGEVDPLAKIKLQLFPVDEVTRIALEKDGLNPFLELTLRARKKIASVIKHIQTKWSGSSIAIGEPMLLPYDAQLRHPATCRRWTSQDTVVTAGDVYKVVGSPAVFRLSYGWFSEHEPQRVSAATDPWDCIKSESRDKQTESTEERKCCDTTDEVAVTEHVDTNVKMGHSHEWSISLRDDDMNNLRIGGLLSEASGPGMISKDELKSSENSTDLQPISLCTDISIGGLLSEASLQGKLHNNELILNGRNMGHQQAPIQWDDSLTALSIGGLLSEASLQAKIKKSDPKSSERDVSGNPSTFISDSFDAIICSQVKSDPQVAKPSSLDSHLSILDAEETCHAFSFRKFSSSSKNVRVSARASQDLSSNSFKFPHLIEVEKQAENASYPEQKTELFPRPQQYGEDSRSLGLRGITWNESLGPFDLGNSLPWKVSGGGNI